MLVTQSCPTLYNPMDCSLTSSSVHGILQTGILEWLVIHFSRGSPRPSDKTVVSCIAGRFFTIWATGKSLCLYKSQQKFIDITADVYRMLEPTALLATLGHVLWADVPAGCLGVLRLRMSVPREEGNLSYDQLLPLPVRANKAAWGNSDSFMASYKCWALLLSFLS